MIKNPVLYLLLVICILLSKQNLLGQHFLKAEGKVIVNENQETILLRGMGLGGWMVQEGYMLQTAEFANPQHQIKNKIQELIGEENTNQFYEAWLDNHVTQKDIDSLKSWGFNSVRLAMHYNLYTLPIEAEPISGEHTWLERGFELTDSLISWCKQREMYVILDLHAAPGGQGQDQGISDYDPSKPSLWESKDNRDKTVALWKRLANRYADEEWVAGYDLLNETNWPMSNNFPLATLYKEITDSIRTVDQRHIIFIEGNWFANDFTGLTPPWDDNLVYSPHKYWSHNDQASIQWALDLRDNFDVPLYLGESGENSNVWFRDAIKLLEDEGIGWAWWPMKKIESIAGPLSVIKTDDYESLLNYWKGNGSKPTEEFAFNALMEITENLKIENCFFQKDVIDAMFRQVNSDETKPYRTQKIPGVLYATDYDMGRNGFAYEDADLATYHVSTGNYTAWNQGWAYRNDGVDIQRCEDGMQTNGYNVGWLVQDEWMQYDIDVAEDAVYNVYLRVASNESNASLHLSIGDVPLTPSYSVPNTQAWQSWRTLEIPNVILNTQDRKLRIYIDNGSFNLSSLRFEKKESSADMNTNIVSAETTSDRTVLLNLNKSIKASLPTTNDFIITVNGVERSIESYNVNVSNSRQINFELSQAFIYNDVIRISYVGNGVQATDDSFLLNFENELVTNNLPVVYTIPGSLEMEDYFEQEGVQLEQCTDIGGGQNISFLDAGDYLNYKVHIENSGDYNLTYRIASEQSNGSCRLILVDNNGQESTINNQSFSATGGWQSWESVESKLTLEEGFYTLRVLITNGPFNINWIKFDFKEQVDEEEETQDPFGLKIYPNPVSESLSFESSFLALHKVSIEIFDHVGKFVFAKEYQYSKSLSDEIEVQNLSPGLYHIKATLEDGTQYILNFVKQ